MLIVLLLLGLVGLLAAVLALWPDRE